MVTELETLKKEARDAAADVLDNPLLFYKNRQKVLPAWTEAFKKFCLLQPSSAAIERVFSIVTRIHKNRLRLLDDYHQLTVMCQYHNKELKLVEKEEPEEEDEEDEEELAAAAAAEEPDHQLEEAVQNVVDEARVVAVLADAGQKGGEEEGEERGGGAFVPEE